MDRAGYGIPSILPRMAAGVSEQVPDAVAPPPGNRRFPLVDGLRAIAVLCVVAVHVGTESVNAGTVAGRLLLHLNIGVALFFLISGFLLYRPLVAHRIGGPKPPAIRDYARRRLLRILPAYWLVLIAVIILPSVAANNDGSWLGQFALVFTLSDSKGWVCIDCGLTQTWSLGVEMTFYAALPFYALLAERIARGRATGEWLRIELLLLAALSAGTAAVQFIHYDAFPPAWLGGSALGFTAWFALGMGLALISVAREERGEGSPSALRAGSLWGAALAIYVGLTAWLPDTPFLFDADQIFVTFAVFGLICLLVMLPAVLDVAPRGLPARFLSLRPVAWVGLVSYGIFLWHIAVIRWINTFDDELAFIPLFALVLALTVPIAAASYYFLERPLLRLKNRRPTRAPASRGVPAKS